MFVAPSVKKDRCHVPDHLPRVPSVTDSTRFVALDTTDVRNPLDRDNPTNIPHVICFGTHYLQGERRRDTPAEETFSTLGRFWFRHYDAIRFIEVLRDRNCVGIPDVVPTSRQVPLSSGFLSGTRLSKCPRTRAGTVSRWSNISLRSEVLSGCVKGQTSSDSESRFSVLGWSMIRLHEPSSLKGFVNGV